MENCGRCLAKGVKNAGFCQQVCTDRTFCPNCGAKLPEQTVAKGNVCPSCGNKNGKAIIGKCKFLKQKQPGAS